MADGQRNEKIKYPLKMKIVLLMIVALVPLLGIAVYLIAALVNYRDSYDSIVSNMTIANNYNLNFKEELDESIYKLAVGYVSFNNIQEEKSLKDPYDLIGELRTDFRELMTITTDRESLAWLQSLLRNIDTLEDRIDDVRINVEAGERYDENMELLDNNVYILTELIQDDIQYYIYYQTKSIEDLTDQLNEQISTFLVLCAWLIGAAVVLVMIIFSLVLKSITNPLERLCKVTERIAKGEFTVRAKIHTKDEIRILSDSVDNMAEKLRIMMNQIKDDERKVRDAELRLLQEQINPHFLYNTLELVIWLAASEENDQVIEVVDKLAIFFKTGLSKGVEWISVEKEIEHVESYLSIQQCRYSDLLSFEICMEPDICQYFMLKMLLQPIVENALYHGIKNRENGGKITIAGKEENGYLLFEVADTGCGMEPEILEDLQQKIRENVLPYTDHENGFGIYNVNRRIRLYYGEDCGLTIWSERDSGTKVTIKLKKHAEGSSHV